MTEFDYVIVGGGLAGASVIQGIRERDTQGSILLVGEETHLPYNRPPLSKKLWFGKARVEDIFVHDQRFYDEHGVSMVSIKTVEKHRSNLMKKLDLHNAAMLTAYAIEKGLTAGSTPKP